ncbi:HamA C-terminal domain-containing protein [Methylobacterium sp. ID0610]|uniref:HamA C-terminal domain-containing protein n=1 Tax=Methylobacterium carpenticola TaxID=3344827 RepID=UPI0036C9300E
MANGGADRDGPDADAEALARALATLLNPSKIDGVVNCCVRAVHDEAWEGPRTGLLHVRFGEDRPRVEDLAYLLWTECMYYALPRRRQERFRREIAADMTAVARCYRAVRDLFIDFNARHPERASELGEVLAYCLVQEHLGAAQVASKMSLKTAANMPVHGLDGIHAVFENGALTVYFLESKLASEGRRGVASYAASAAEFLSDRRQYLREYEIVADLGNLDALEGEARQRALDHFDVIGHPELRRRERFVGIICHSEPGHFGKRLRIRDDQPPDIHERDFAERYAADHGKLRLAARKQLLKHGADPAKAIVLLVAVPDVRELRKAFYAAMGVAERELPLDGDDLEMDDDEDAGGDPA